MLRVTNPAEKHRTRRPTSVHHDAGHYLVFYYTLKDLYTVDALVNNRGHEVERYTYDAYGMPVMRAIRTTDVDYNGTVNAIDLGLVQAATDPCTDGPMLDIDGNGTINATDQGLVQSSYGPAVAMLYTSGLGNAYFFTGRRMHHFDSNLIDLGPAPNTAIQYNRARHYDPEYGRWLQRDTLGEVVRVTWGNYYKKGQPRFIGLRRSPKVYRDGMDLYQYGRSNPLKFIDPNGLVCGPAQDKLLDRLIPDRPPTWFGPCDFRSACRWHDECYGICGKTKRECDDGFWQRMEWDALFQKGPLRRCACSSLALLYHKAVVGFAQEIYDAAQKHACKEKEEEKKEPEPPHPCETIADNLYFDCMTATGGNHIQCSHDARDAFSNCMDDLEG